MGAAGFGRAPDFFDKLMECRALGARLVMLEALETGQPLVVADRYEVVAAGPRLGAAARAHAASPLGLVRERARCSSAGNRSAS